MLSRLGNRTRLRIIAIADKWQSQHLFSIALLAHSIFFKELLTKLVLNTMLLYAKTSFPILIFLLVISPLKMFRRRIHPLSQLFDRNEGINLYYWLLFSENKDIISDMFSTMPR